MFNRVIRLTNWNDKHMPGIYFFSFFLLFYILIVPSGSDFGIGNLSDGFYVQTQEVF
jgi:hypothetical protein